MYETLIFEIGEAILLEVNGVKDIVYPRNADKPERLVILADNGRKIELTLKAI